MAELFKQPVFRLVGDRGLLVEYGDAIDPEINRKVRIMSMALERELPQGVIEAIPTYRSILIQYDPSHTDPEALKKALAGLEGKLGEISIPEAAVVEIPVCYGGAYGPDLDYVAQVNGLSVEQVIEIHSSRAYQIYMIGFTPGFPFLGGMDERIATPRLESPPHCGAGRVGGHRQQPDRHVPGDQPGRVAAHRPDPAQAVQSGPGKPLPVQGRGSHSIQAHLRRGVSGPGRGGGVMDMFKVLASGPMATIQDLGRFGFQQYGVPVSGGMDRFALRCANLLVGNPEDEAVVELTFTGLKLEALAQADVAVTGAKMPVTVNDRQVDNWTSFAVQPGDVITIKPALQGLRGYLAVTGGFDLPRVMGSRSTYLGGGIGGYKGRGLDKGDILARGAGEPQDHSRQLPPELRPALERGADPAGRARPPGRLL